MNDVHGRGINYLRISVTQACNLRCSYCVPARDSTKPHCENPLSFGEITRLVKIFSGVGIKKVRVTGGEPLVLKGVPGFIRDLKSLHGIEEVALSTNGVLLSGLLDELKGSGLDKINVSLDSLRRERVREISGSDVLPDVMGAVERIMAGNLFQLKLNVVLIKGFNDDEILDFARLAFLHPLEVRFIEMMPTAQNRLWDGKKPLTGAEAKSVIEQEFRLSPLFDPGRFAGPAKVYATADGKGRLGFISPMSGSFCDGCNRLRLTADGRIRHCLFSDAEVDLRPGFFTNEPDEWFLKRFVAALAQKPSAHNLTNTSAPPCSRPMSAIGG